MGQHFISSKHIIKQEAEQIFNKTSRQACFVFTFLQLGRH